MEKDNVTVDKKAQTSLPDTQNYGAREIKGANVPIMQVGVSGFRMPLRFMTASGEPVSLDTSVTGMVSLAADHKGVNMSRIMRVFYDYESRVFTPEILEEILREYKVQIGSSRTRLKLDFAYPIRKKSLRSDLSGWQYYDSGYEGFLDDLDVFTRRIHFDYVYSSACPCSAELSDHAKATRGVYAIPHSQRSRASLIVEIKRGSFLSIEDLQAICERAIPTETQVMVKREDEQAFAELSGANPMFVEDAARLLFEQLDSDKRIEDFSVSCVHMESLHSHNAVAVINKGCKPLEPRLDQPAQEA
jgi:GTP cyclohydrolase I